MRNFPTISATATKLQDKVTTLAPLIKRRSCPSRELPVTVIRKTLARIALATAGALLAPHAMAADISGAGATFPYPIYAQWADAYKKETNVGMNYQSIGSGGGIKQIKAKTVTFGASDAPLEPDELADMGAIPWPMEMA